jgi:tRNA pseudouridine55 synthase
MARSRKPATKHGYIVIDKPAGWTSHDVVAKVRRIVGEKRVGHAGTLDPAATGVLPIAVGNATRTIEYLAEADKAYRADITFGVVTDSADGEGEILDRNDVSSLSLADIEVEAIRFVGEISQVPPMHSAIKVNGRRLYDLARSGETIDIAPRTVTIHALTIIEWSSPVLTIDVTCSKGTYIRSLARDLGEAVGYGAHLSALRRTRVGAFTLNEAISLDDLATRDFEAIAMPPDVAMAHLAKVTLDEPRTQDWFQGKRVAGGDAPGIVRVYDASGRWLGVGKALAMQLGVQPIKVVHPTPVDAR